MTPLEQHRFDGGGGTHSLRPAASGGRRDLRRMAIFDVDDRQIQRQAHDVRGAAAGQRAVGGGRYAPGAAALPVCPQLENPLTANIPWRSRRLRGALAGQRRTIVALLGVAIVLVLHHRSLAAQAPPSSRIVSLVPAVTEILFAIGAGARVVGVGSFDRYPPEVATRPRVGALVDPDLERMLGLRPDLVVIYASQEDLRRQLTRAGVGVFPYRHGGLADVTSTIRAVGNRIGFRAQAAGLADGIERDLAEIESRVAGRTRPTVLLVFGREAGSLRGAYASGGVGFLHDMLALAGGRNVFADVARESLQASTELILARRPEIIVELVSDGLSGRGSEGADNAWQALGSVPAIRDGRIVTLVGDEFVVPGPRVALAAGRLARALHSEAFTR
jgi:ABC-type Fe3+-hydroxamate transport system substrate-binding protein